MITTAVHPFVVVLSVSLCPGCAPSLGAGAIPQKIVQGPPWHAPKVDLGTVPQRGTASYSMWLENCTDTTIEIARIRTTCDCLVVVVRPLLILSGEQAGVTFTFDAGNDDDFAGSLAIAVEAFDARGKRVLDANVHAAVGARGEDKGGI